MKQNITFPFEIFKIDALFNDELLFNDEASDVRRRNAPASHSYWQNIVKKSNRGAGITEFIGNSLGLLYGLRIGLLFVIPGIIIGSAIGFVRGINQLTSPKDAILEVLWGITEGIAAPLIFFSGLGAAIAGKIFRVPGYMIGATVGIIDNGITLAGKGLSTGFHLLGKGLSKGFHLLGNGLSKGFHLLGNLFHKNGPVENPAPAASREASVQINPAPIANQNASRSDTAGMMIHFANNPPRTISNERSLDSRAITGSQQVTNTRPGFAAGTNPGLKFLANESATNNANSNAALTFKLEKDEDASAEAAAQYKSKY